MTEKKLLIVAGVALLAGWIILHQIRKQSAGPGKKIIYRDTPGFVAA